MGGKNLLIITAPTLSVKAAYHEADQRWSWECNFTLCSSCRLLLLGAKYRDRCTLLAFADPHVRFPADHISVW